MTVNTIPKANGSRLLPSGANIRFAVYDDHISIWWGDNHNNEMFCAQNSDSINPIKKDHWVACKLDDGSILSGKSVSNQCPSPRIPKELLVRYPGYACHYDKLKKLLLLDLPSICIFPKFDNKVISWIGRKKPSLNMDYPNTCPRCKGVAYIGLNVVDCPKCGRF
jgi:hypothetical protein